ncbi:hypothetical protein [Shimia sp.]|uniref:hypothetical protein n=1 Tax=Shimia sp. TaxID=1954381 RepID=UPI003BA875A1
MPDTPISVDVENSEFDSLLSFYTSASGRMIRRELNQFAQPMYRLSGRSPSQVIRDVEDLTITDVVTSAFTEAAPEKPKAVTPEKPKKPREKDSDFDFKNMSSDDFIEWLQLRQRAWGSYIYSDMSGFAARVNEELRSGDYFRASIDASWRLDDYLRSLQLSPSPSDSKLVHYFESRDAYYKGKRSAPAKAGRVIKRLFPMLTDAQIERLVDYYKENFVIDLEGVEVQSGQTRSDFNRIYDLTRSENHNVQNSSDFKKHLAYSCMHHQTAGGIIAGEVYASGDFTAYWIEQNDKLMARCVVRTDCDPIIAGPVYGTSDAAVGALRSHLEGLGAKVDDYEGWEGARLLRIEVGDSWLGVYSDMRAAKADKSSCGDFWILCDEDEDADVELSNTNGRMELLNSRRCDCCGEREDRDELREAVNNYDMLCDDCFHEQHGICDHSHDYVDRDELERVLVSTSNGHPRYEEWGYVARCHHASFCNYTNEYVSDVIVLSDSEGDSVSPRALEEGYVSECSDDGELYPSTEMVHRDGELVHRSNIDETTHFFDQASNEWREREAA